MTYLLEYAYRHPDASPSMEPETRKYWAPCLHAATSFARWLEEDGLQFGMAFQKMERLTPYHLVYDADPVAPAPVRRPTVPPGEKVRGEG